MAEGTWEEVTQPGTILKLPAWKSCMSPGPCHSSLTDWLPSGEGPISREVQVLPEPAQVRGAGNPDALGLGAFPASSLSHFDDEGRAQTLYAQPAICLV